MSRSMVDGNEDITINTSLWYSLACPHFFFCSLKHTFTHKKNRITMVIRTKRKKLKYTQKKMKNDVKLNWGSNNYKNLSKITSRSSNHVVFVAISLCVNSYSYTNGWFLTYSTLETGTPKIEGTFFYLFFWFALMRWSEFWTNKFAIK